MECTGSLACGAVTEEGLADDRYDVAVIGAGAAGAAAAAFLAAHCKVVLCDQERLAGSHSTARSAAVLSECYGPRGWQLLGTAARAFLEHPPDGFTEQPLLHRFGALFLAEEHQVHLLEAESSSLRARGVDHQLLPIEEALALSPAVRRGKFTLGLHEPGCAHIDVSSLLGGYLRLFRQRSGTMSLGSEVLGLTRVGDRWQINTATGQFSAAKVVNAAGAWVDDIASRAGLPRRGIVPLRRTAIAFDPPPGVDISRWPMTFDMSEAWYFKPEGGRIMMSPADKTPSVPCDCQPEEIDIAIAVDRVETVTSLKVGRIASRWAGLRTFAADQQPVIGPDPVEPSFFWLAGQGGNGVMASPGAAELVASLVLEGRIPESLAKLGVSMDAIGPGRLPPA